MTTREQLWDSTAAAHADIQCQHYELRALSKAVGYLHPEFAADLLRIAADIEFARQTIQGNADEMISMDIRESQTAFHNTIVAAFTTGKN